MTTTSKMRPSDPDNGPSESGVVVSRASVESAEPYDVIESNISFVNALRREHFTEGEISADALRSYYVDYHRAEGENGGFSQFVYNTRWDAAVVRYVREGLRAMGAIRHAELFESSAAIIDELGPARLQEYLDGEYFGPNEDRDLLNAHDDAFYALSQEEDLVALNAAWLRAHPDLRVLSVDAMQAEIDRRVAAMTDRAEHVAAARLAEPDYVKAIRALCAAAGHELERVTGGDPSHVFEGRRALAWHFLTDQGHHYMVQSGGRAIMFGGKTHACIVEVDVPAS